MFGTKKLFETNIEPRCVYCAKGAPLDDGSILCAKRGVVTPGSACGSFRYDPLKRVPPKPATPDFSKLSDEDFRLD